MRHPYSASFSHPTGSHRYPIRQTNSVANLFPTPHRPTKLLIAPAACKSLKILEVASRALASLLITERGICGNRAAKHAVQGATLARPKAFLLGEWAKKIPTDKGWDFEYWWCDGNRRQTAYELLMRASVGWCGLAWSSRVFIGWWLLIQRRRTPLSLFSSIPRFAIERASALISSAPPCHRNIEFWHLG